MRDSSSYLGSPITGSVGSCFESLGSTANFLAWAVPGWLRSDWARATGDLASGRGGRERAWFDVVLAVRYCPRMGRRRVFWSWRVWPSAIMVVGCADSRGLTTEFRESDHPWKTKHSRRTSRRGMVLPD